ncbi:hypothetical protein DITRI_Ditri06bG0125100 [Diplodiscus trichospermus]
MPGRMTGRMEPFSQGLGVTASFGASVTTKISNDASLAGFIVGKNGVNSKRICRVNKSQTFHKVFNSTFFFTGLCGTCCYRLCSFFHVVE